MVGTKSTKTVTIEKRGAFHDDSFFKDSWDNWDKAMEDVISRWDNETPPTAVARNPPTEAGTETRSVYRKIRSSNVTSDDSQAVSCTEEDDKYKVVIDVKHFKPEDINVKTVDDTVVVEGKVEKKEGNSISTQKFVRRFLLPPGIELNSISSALSKDGVLTINAPKKATKQSITSGRSVPLQREIVSSSKNTYSGNLPTAGKPTIRDPPQENFNRAATHTTHLMREPSPKRSFNLPAAGKPSYTPSSPTYSTTATVGSNSSRSSLNPSDKSSSGRVTENISFSVPDRRGSDTTFNTEMSSFAKDHWNNFNNMVERSQNEMDEMMKRHTLNTSIDPPQSTTLKLSYPSSSNAMVVPSNGVNSTRDIIRDGNKVTERQEHSWNDNLAPGIVRNNRARTEVSTIKNSAGDILGVSDKKQQHSHAEGSREEILPDGSKLKTFTKTYEKKNFYSVNSNGTKAV